MLNRVTVALGLVFLGVFATTGVSYAASDKTEVMVTTGLVVIALMLFLLIAYVVKLMFGGGGMPPPEPDANDHAHH
jgi:hypothetical protein